MSTPDDSLLPALFAKARDQYESATRWSMLIVIALFLLHLMTVGPFLRVMGSQAAAETELERLHTAKLSVLALRDGLAELQRLAAEAPALRIGELMEALKCDFRQLDATLDAHFAAISEPARPGDEVARSSPLQMQQSPSLQMQQPPSLQMQQPPSLQMQQQSLPASSNVPGCPQANRIPEAALPTDIDRMMPIDDLRQALHPLIELYLVTPRFDAFNADWIEQARPAASLQIAVLAAAVEELRGALPEAEQGLAEVADDLERIGARLAEWRLHAPDDSFWWASEVVKDEVGREAVAALSERAADDFAGRAVHAITRQTEALIAGQERLITRLAQEAERLAADFERQREQLTDISEAFGALTVGLDALAKRFPLLLGVILAASVAWHTRQQRQLAMVVRIAERHGGGRLYREWYEHSAAAPPSMVRRALLWTLAGVAWIAIAGWQVWHWPEVGRLDAAVMTGLGAAALAGAHAYRLVQLRRITSAAQEGAGEQGPD